MKKDDVEKLAELARLKLSSAELDELSENLSEILQYVGQLNELDLTDTEPTSQVTGLMNVLRVDKSEDDSQQRTKKMLELAPASTRSDSSTRGGPKTQDQYVKVPGVFENQGDE